MWRRRRLNRCASTAQGISKQEALRHLDWDAFLDARTAAIAVEAELGLTSLAEGAPSGIITAAGGMAPACASAQPPSMPPVAAPQPLRARAASWKLKPLDNPVMRKLAAVQKKIASLVADAHARAVGLEPPRNLVEFTLATFTDDEVLTHPFHFIPEL
jgi:hypothetical protein